MATTTSNPQNTPDPKMVERYQQMLEENPSSKVFAPLADAYRQMDMMEEAFELCKKGVREHPDFAGGRIALANLYLDKNEPELAYDELYKAHMRSPENLACLNKVAEVSLRLKKTYQAFQFYQKLLQISPTHTRAKKAVEKLDAHFKKHPEEIPSADDDGEEYQMQKLKPLSAIPEVTSSRISSEYRNDDEEPPVLTPEPENTNTDIRLNRFLSLADAHFSQNDFDKANVVLIDAEKNLGSHPEIVKRLKTLHLRQLDPIAPPKRSSEVQAPLKRSQQKRQKTIKTLENLLSKFKSLQDSSEEDLKL